MEWVLDSGSTMHCCSDLRIFVELNPVQNSYIHTLGTDVRVRGVGTAVLRAESSGEQVRLHNVLYVPGAPKWCAIISMGQLQSHRAVTQGAGDYMTMTLEDGTQIVGRRKTTAGLAEAPSSHLLFHVRGATLSPIEMMGARVQVMRELQWGAEDGAGEATVTKACLRQKQNGYSAGVNVIKGGAFRKQFGEPERFLMMLTIMMMMLTILDLGGRQMEVGLVDNLLAGEQK